MGLRQPTYARTEGRLCGCGQIMLLGLMSLLLSATDLDSLLHAGESREVGCTYFGYTYHGSTYHG